MSRRKQARPRSCKRSGEEEDDVEGEMEPVHEDENVEEEPLAKRLCVSDSIEQGDNGIKMSNNADGEGVVNGNRSDSGDTGEFHCDTCGSLFGNLEQFMDHRNFECVPEYEGENHPWTIDNLAVNMGPPESPLSSESLGDSPLSALDCPLSPASENMTPEQVPSGVGVSDVNPYGCQFCEKAFPKLSYLKIHEQVHSDQLPFKCAFCSRLFRHKRSRDRHVKLHTGDKKYKCSQCDSAFARSDHLKSHLKTHENGKPFQCTICNRGYQTAAGLTSHVMIHKKNAESSSDLQCQQCKDVFPSLAELHNHMLIHREEIAPGKSSVHCPYCGDVCPSQDALKLHVEQMHIADQLTNCPICQKSCLNTDDLVHHMATHDLLTVDRIPTDEHNLSGSTTGATASLTHSLGGQPLVSEMLVCPYCFSSDYDSLEILEIHMQSVHSVKPTEVYTCNYCNAPYQNLYSLHEHMRAVHQNQPCMDIKYPCTHCSRQFSSIENLQQHKKLIHYYERRERSESRDPLYCIMCSMAFQSAGALQDHMAMMHHSSPKSEPKYSDTKSHSNTSNKRRSSLVTPGSEGGYHHKRDNDKSFNRRGINMHLNFTSTPEPHKDQMPTSSPYQDQVTCDHCNATFHDRKNFQAHIKLHLENSAGGPYCCKLCKQQFSTEDQLEKHSSTHYLSMTTEYGCTSCVKFFSKPDELQKHLMDIHAHHLYRCSLCKEIFDSKVNVQVHFAIKHSNECKLYKCTKCDSVFRSEMEWQVHVRVNHLHVAKPYRCLFCKESFSSEMDLQCHLTTHNKPFRCPMCDESFHVEYLLDKHMQCMHGNPTDKAIPPPPQMSPVKIKVERDVDTPSYNDRTPPHPSPRYSPKNLNGPGIWKSSELLHTCNICDMKFEQQALLQAHKAVDHGLSAKKSSTSSASVSPDQVTIMKPESDHHPVRKPVTSVVSSASVAPTSSMASLASITSAAMTLQERLQADTSMPPAVSHSPITSKSMSLPVVVISEKLSLACMYCSQTFKSRGDLDKHMKIHQNNGSQKCNICDQVFPTSSILAEHKLTHCKIVQGNSCVLCKIPLKNEDQFYVHTQEHGFQGTFMQCLICRQTLASMVELQMHGKHHFQVKSSFYTCCVCLKTFNSKENLVSKMNSSGRTYYVCKPCYHGEHSEYVCSECGASFPSNGELDTHIGTHKKSYQCIKCQESFSSEYEIQLHVATHMMTEGNVHDCKLCSRTFESPAKLQCHLIDHTYRNSEFRCSVCCKIFASSMEIQNHAIEHGPGARRYGCSQCSQKFFFSAELENHAFMHTVGENSISLTPVSSDLTCTDCNKTFTSSVSLINHRKIHEHNENNFKCNVCAEVFHSMGALQSHFCHSELDKQTYRCPECDKELPSLSSLQSHLRIHRLGKENRQSHIRPYPGGKPFLCPVCGKSFVRKCQIKEHMRVHFAQDSSQLADMQSFLDVDVNSDNASITSDDNGDEPTSNMSFRELDGGKSGEGSNSLTTNDINNHVEGGRQKEQSMVC